MELMSKAFVRLVVLVAVVASVLPAFGQKAGKISRFVAPAFVDQPGSRPGLSLVSLKAVNDADVRWGDILRTADGGRMRVTLNDNSILSLGSKSSMKVVKHDEVRQQSQFELNY